uniref:Uncharacterized protein n=1 Tax=Oryza sativa subsp. japonica TaxID=39947 RepID=Q5Z673_ORYSJ|nr:hypothetical protein [Oryza sativa Japonica Group]
MQLHPLPRCLYQLGCTQGSRSPAPRRLDTDRRRLDLAWTLDSAAPLAASLLRHRLQPITIMAIAAPIVVIPNLVRVMGSNPVTSGKRKVPPSLPLWPHSFQRPARVAARGGGGGGCWPMI